MSFYLNPVKGALMWKRCTFSRQRLYKPNLAGHKPCMPHKSLWYYLVTGLKSVKDKVTVKTTISVITSLQNL